MPWLYEVKRFSELYRQKFHRWIDEQYRKQGFDPDAPEAAGDALCEELKKTTDAGARASWERLKDLLTNTPDEASS